MNDNEIITFRLPRQFVRKLEHYAIETNQTRNQALIALVESAYTVLQYEQYRQKRKS